MHPKIPLAIIGGLVAALLGGAIWGAITYYTEYEVGYIAWGIGFITGFAILLWTQQSKGIPFQVVGAVCSLLGIFVGKYVAFYSFASQQFTSEGEELGSIWSPDLIIIFAQNITEFASIFDALWVFLAVSTVWSMLKAETAAE